MLRIGSCVEQLAARTQRETQKQTCLLHPHIEGSPRSPSSGASRHRTRSPSATAYAASKRQAVPPPRCARDSNASIASRQRWSARSRSGVASSSVKRLSLLLGSRLRSVLNFDDKRLPPAGHTGAAIEPDYDVAAQVPVVYERPPGVLRTWDVGTVDVQGPLVRDLPIWRTKELSHFSLAHSRTQAAQVGARMQSEDRAHRQDEPDSRSVVVGSWYWRPARTDIHS